MVLEWKQGGSEAPCSVDLGQDAATRGGVTAKRQVNSFLVSQLLYLHSK